MKLLIDMNLSPRWVARLAADGFDSVHWSEIGAASATDREIMSYAARGGYIVMTHDLDFGAILAATKGKNPSVVQIRSQEISPEIIVEKVISALRQMEAELADGALLSIDASSLRLRVLPLK